MLHSQECFLACHRKQQLYSRSHGRFSSLEKQNPVQKKPPACLDYSHITYPRKTVQWHQNWEGKSPASHITVWVQTRAFHVVWGKPCVSRPQTDEGISGPSPALFCLSSLSPLKPIKVRGKSILEHVPHISKRRGWDFWVLELFGFWWYVFREGEVKCRLFAILFDCFDKELIMYI